MLFLNTGVSAGTLFQAMIETMDVIIVQKPALRLENPGKKPSDNDKGGSDHQGQSLLHSIQDCTHLCRNQVGYNTAEDNDYFILQASFLLSGILLQFKLYTISVLTVVESPIIMEQPVPISAAQAGERVIPPSMGEHSSKSSAAPWTRKRPEESTLPATPKIAHIKPTGTIKAPKMKPFLAALSSFPVRPICTTPWTEFVAQHDNNPAYNANQPIPAVKLR